MIYFVTENYLKTNGIITANVDVTDFSPLIQFAARAFVEDMIGTYFFEDLLEKYNTQTLNTEEELLVKKMQYAIAWRACAQAGVTLTYQLKNKGFQKQNDDNAESVELNEVTFMYDQYIQQALMFERKLGKFLNQNKDDYPVYLDALNKNSSLRHTECGNKGGTFNEGIGLIII